MTLGRIDLSKIGSNHITAEDTDFDCLCRAVRLPNQYSFFDVSNIFISKDI